MTHSNIMASLTKSTLKSTIIIGLFTVCVTTHAKSQTTAPKEIQDQWYMSKNASCDALDFGKMTITSDSVKFWNGSGKIKNVQIEGDRYTVSVSMLDKAKGKTWTRTDNYVLKNNKKSLVNMLSDGTTVPRHRCR